MHVTTYRTHVTVSQAMTLSWIQMIVRLAYAYRDAR
jgi:hypothetical protein